MKSLLAFLFLAMFIVSVQGDVRCHCNQPECMRTGYMCTATGPQAACFVEHSPLRHFNDNDDEMSMGRSGGDISRHGCIEMLPVKERNRCLSDALASLTASVSGLPSTVRSRQSAQSTVQCCLDDMCNAVRAFVIDDEDSGDDRDTSVEQQLRNSNERNDIDSLVKHLQQIYGTTHDQDRAPYMLLCFTLAALAALVVLIAFGIRFLRASSSLEKTKGHNTFVNRVPGTTILTLDANQFQPFYATHHHPSQQHLLMGVHIDPSATTIVDEYTHLGHHHSVEPRLVAHLPEVVAGSILPANNESHILQQSSH